MQRRPVIRIRRTRVGVSDQELPRRVPLARTGTVVQRDAVALVSRGDISAEGTQRRDSRRVAPRGGVVEGGRQLGIAG